MAKKNENKILVIEKFVSDELRAPLKWANGAIRAQMSYFFFK